MTVSNIRKGVLVAVDVVSVTHPQYIPAVSQETGCDVLGKGDSRIPLAGDVIVVVDPAKFVSLRAAD